MTRRQLQGIVVSAVRNKTVTVEVERKFMHNKYKKIMCRHKKYSAHDEDNAYKVGDVVTIEESRPISKTKSWIVVTKPATIN